MQHYTSLEDLLSENHLMMLRQQSGITDDVIAARKYRTIRDPQELYSRNFSRQQSNNVPGLLLPVHTTDGSDTLFVYRPDSPRVIENRRKRNQDGSFKCEVIKYDLPKDAGMQLDCPPVCRPMLADPSIRLWITEGQKKADALASRGVCAIDLLGVWDFKGKNGFGATTFLADWDYVALEGREVCIVFDSDLMLKPSVRKALERLTEHLQRKGARVRAVYLPSVNVQKIGVDDYLLTRTVADLEGLIERPRPQPQPAPPRIELLDGAPSVIRRPLALADGRAYAAVWPYVKVTVTEGLDKEGNILTYDEPRVRTEQRLLIIRDDGLTFGDGGFEPMKNLGLEVILPEIPQPDRLWSSGGIKSYQSGNRPAPSDGFNRVADVVSRFIDFDHSLADQRTMSELVACYILATWFLDAFTVIGFLWPNGERGSGKTQLLTLVAELSYLGQVILAGGSYATLRDMADYGATLCFDDAENLADPKRTDPDKRTLLLAGNRRGNTVPIKEKAAEGRWRTRHVHTFCARCFSAIRLPDITLASRTIIIPLVRTPDRHRANADPLVYGLWPHDRRKLIDGLWAMGLANLTELSRYEAAVNARAKLTGRNLEPWRAILAVAAWLEDMGVKGLWERMEKLSVGYQDERQGMESADLTALVIRAVCKCLVPECDVVTF